MFQITYSLTHFTHSDLHWKFTIQIQKLIITHRSFYFLISTLSNSGARLPGPYWHSNGLPDHVEPAGVPSLPHFWIIWGRFWPYCEQLPQVQRQGHSLLPCCPAPQRDGRGRHKNRQAPGWTDRLWLRGWHTSPPRAKPRQSAWPRERQREGERAAEGAGTGTGAAEGAGARARARKRQSVVL